MTANLNALRILEYWWVLELFSPQRVPQVTGRSRRPEDRQVVEWRSGESLPWEVLRPPQPVGKTRRVWRHTVYLGVYDLEATYQYLHKSFAEDRDAYDERRAGLSACAGVLVDENGVLLSDTAVLSSALWAVSSLVEGTHPRGTGWASGFTVAAAGLVERFDELEGARREAASQEAPLAQDGDSLQGLLAAAHAAAEITGHDELATPRIVIRSVAVSAGRGDEPVAGNDFLNSFFLDDLAAIHDDVGTHGPVGALADYLTEDASVRNGTRIDVMADDSAVDDGVSIGRLPKGRWLADPQHGLTLRQQFAVNRALGELPSTIGILGVNGPPGTGKTTMLRDMLAGNVVERARRLASLTRADDAFTETVHRWNAAGGYERQVPQLRADLIGFEMVVASANNAAVENVTTEIPSRASIADRWRDQADYFADIATATSRTAFSDDETSSDATNSALTAWGLIAAKLGNKSNRGAFRSEFWFDKTDPRTTQRRQGTAPRMRARLVQWRDGETPKRSWLDAREAFWAAERRVDELIEARRGAEERLVSLSDAIRDEASAAELSEKLEAELVSVAEAMRLQSEGVHRAAVAVALAMESRSRHVETRPGSLETLFSLGRAMREWRNALEPIDAAVHSARERQRALQQRADYLEDARVNLEAEFSRAEDDRARLAADLMALRKQLTVDREQYGSAYPSTQLSGRERELSSPWLDAELNAARSDLFLAALQLHEDFVATTSGRMLDGLRAAVEVVAGDHPRQLEPEKVGAAWQLFFLVVPMVSTTFASLGRMFTGMGRQSLGWVFIDEAGQASPQYAVGAIWRARRVVCVGDPLQLEPVVSIPAKVQRDIALAYSVSDTWIPPQASAQTLADRVSQYGTRLFQGDKPVWVGAPLTVHRRCDDPMFSLCNDIAYNGIMVSGVSRRPDVFDGPEGPRILTSRWLDETASTAETHLQPNQIARLRREIEALRTQGIAAGDIIAISPFREVASELKKLGTDYPGLISGTIHTAQGREADVVFLVLGGDPAKPGAKAWAAATVNLVNVAASRAKRRLYVIGDRSAWAKYNYFNQLAAALDQHRQDRQGA